MKKQIAYYIFNYMPKWEAASKEVYSLNEYFGKANDTSLFAFNLKKKKLSWNQREKHIPLPFGLLFFPFLAKISSKYDINHIFASAGEKLLLSRIKGKRKILTVTKETKSLSIVEENIPLLKTLDSIIVECERHKEILLQAGIDEKKLHLIYPYAELSTYNKPDGAFKILFASSPPSKHDLLNRGILLMLKVALKMPEIKFIFAWRDSALNDILELIKKEGASNIIIENGEINDMTRLYREAHAVALPGLTYNSLKPCPHSGLESLAHGKPILVSRPTSIANLIEKNNCGIVFEPTIDGMIFAIKQMIKDYDSFRVNCQNAINKYFSKNAFIEAYSNIYEINLHNQ